MNYHVFIYIYAYVALICGIFRGIRHFLNNIYLLHANILSFDIFSKKQNKISFIIINPTFFHFASLCDDAICTKSKKGAFIRSENFY